MSEALDVEALAAEFARAQALFAKRYPHVAKYKLAVIEAPCVSDDHCAPRDYAFCDPRRRVVGLHFRVFTRPRTVLRGLLYHELAHAADPSLGEAETDALARRVTGKTIRYTPDGVQTIGKGRRRGAWIYKGHR